MEPIKYTSVINSPIGLIEITASEQFVRSIHFLDKECPLIESDNIHIKTCSMQLAEYFNGMRKDFDFSFEQTGTMFQKKVWDALLNISFGNTTSYLALSKIIGDVKAIRAVGTANGRNNLAIVVPCHRVIGSNNKLVGYAGGLWRKEWLLKHEMKLSGIKAGQLF